MTLAEIRFGIEQVDNDAFRQELNQWLETILRPWFSDRLLGIDEEVILVWRRMVEKGHQQGYTFSQPDLFIAAIAHVHGLWVVTRNVGDFERSGVPVFNPFLSYNTFANKKCKRLAFVKGAFGETEFNHKSSFSLSPCLTSYHCFNSNSKFKISWL